MFDQEGDTAALIALKYSQYKSAEILFYHGAIDNFEFKSIVPSTLFINSRDGNEKVLQVLLKNGADIDIQDRVK